MCCHGRRLIFFYFPIAGNESQIGFPIAGNESQIGFPIAGNESQIGFPITGNESQIGFPIAANESQIGITLCRWLTTSKFVDTVQIVKHFLSRLGRMLKTS